MRSIERDRILALAGVFQAALLVQQLARHGQADKNTLCASIHSVLMIDAGSAEEVYGGVHGVNSGLQLVRDKLRGTSEAIDLEIARYLISMIQLENALRKRPALVEKIRHGIETVEQQMKFFASDGDGDTVHPKLVEKLADLYTQTVSTLTPRIMVSGEKGHLANPLTAAKVRSALLAGIRATVLWRQFGGNRWQLLFSRRKISDQASRILTESRHLLAVH